MTEQLNFHFSLWCIEEGNGNPLQCSFFFFPTPIFMPGESQGQRSLVGSHLWDRTVSHDWYDLAAAAVCQTSGSYISRDVGEKKMQLCFSIIPASILDWYSCPTKEWGHNCSEFIQWNNIISNSLKPISPYVCVVLCSWEHELTIYIKTNHIAKWFKDKHWS